MSETSGDRELLFDSCGSTGPLVLQVLRGSSGPGQEQTYTLPFALIGRNERNDLCLNDPAVSRRHAYVQLISGTPFCIDLGARTGMRWGGQASRFGWLGPGAAVHIGPFTLQSSQQGPPMPPGWSPLGAGSLAAGTACWRVEIVAPGLSPIRWKIDRMLTTVGSSPHCKLRLPAGKVSRFHCLLFSASGRLWVIDLLSREGTLVAGEAVRWCRLQEGSDVRVGPITLIVRQVPGEPGARAPILGPHELSALAGDAGKALQPSALSPPALLSSSPSPLLVPREAFSQPAELAKWGAALFRPVFEQLNLMHQQMFEQMQQFMLLTAETFSNLQQEQSANVRAELEQIKQITQELQTLQQLQRESTLAASVPDSPAPASPTPEAPVPADAPAAVPEPLESPPAADAPAVASEAPESPPPAEPPAPVSEEVGESPEPAPAPAAEEPAQPPEPPAAPAADAPSPPPRVVQPSFPSAEAFHAQLSERIASLEQERRSRWQKILGFLQGHK